MESETVAAVTDSTASSEPSQHAAAQRETQQTSILNPAIEQQSTPASTAEQNTDDERDTLYDNNPIENEGGLSFELREDMEEERGKDKLSEEEAEKEKASTELVQAAESECQSVEGVRELSSSLTAMVHLPRSLSPDSSQSSSIASSCFVTPASTPSRSPSPSPHFTQTHSFASVSLPSEIPGSDVIDGGNHGNNSTPINAHLEGDRDDDPSDLNHHFIDDDREVDISHAASQTDAPLLIDSSTGTEVHELIDAGAQTESGERRRRDVACNTELHVDPELLDRAALQGQLAQIRSEHAAGLVEQNEAKSRQMVAEELARIVQAELVDMRQRNVADTTARIRLENQLGELKVELSSAHKGLEEKTQRVTELEDTLKGTSLLVRKLEEQSAVSLMNRGGIDHMLQAKLADSRAQEAEQNLEVTQTELLHAQGEVRRLLERVGETTRDRSEMVSSNVHNQLLQIADERANTAEHKALQLERELLNLRGQSDEMGLPLRGLTTSSLSHTIYSKPSSYTSTLGGYPTLSSTLLPPSLPPSLTSLSSLSTSTTLPKPSLEPFKLTFSLPSSSSSSFPGSSSAVGVGDSERAALPSSTRASYLLSATTTTDEQTGLLKPSAVLGKGSSWDTPTMTSSLSPGERDVETDDAPSVELPSLDLSSPLPPPTNTAADETKDSSSDWSTSEDEEDEGNGFNPLRPSTHSTLQAQWEWRAMGAETSHSDKHIPGATGHTPKMKAPPPVAPKPRVAWTHSSSLTGYSDTSFQLQEHPSTFSEPARVSGLNPLSSSFRRPRGPLGRNLPSRFSNNNQPLF